jgi:predicted nucleotidyltransferase component of viral defense system
MTAANNLSVSIHQKLLNKATAEHRPFNELLQYYAIERFLFRLGKSPYSNRFVLKGALVFLAWQAPRTRPTRDMDFLGYTENSVDNLVQIVRKICKQEVERDGLSFDPDSVEGEIIKEDADYQGVRVKFLGHLGRARINMRLDVGFADIVTPEPKELEIPTILDEQKRPFIRAYPPETVIAEKFQAIVALGTVNSRLKDFYDLWYMANSMEFEIGLLGKAIEKTFKQRNTSLPEQIPAALTEEFAVQKQVQWVAFLRKSQIGTAPNDLIEVIDRLKTFFDPFIGMKEGTNQLWVPSIGWSE